MGIGSESVRQRIVVDSRLMFAVVSPPACPNFKVDPGAGLILDLEALSSSTLTLGVRGSHRYAPLGTNVLLKFSVGRAYLSGHARARV